MTAVAMTSAASSLIIWGSASALSPSREKSMVGICCSSIAWRTGSTTLSSSW